MGAAPLAGTASRAGAVAAVIAGAAALAVAADGAASLRDQPLDAMADALVGLVWVTAGAALWGRGHAPLSASLMVAFGVTWLVGGLVPEALYLHRGPLVHLLLTHPSGRGRSPWTRVVIPAAYVVGAVAGLGSDPVVTIVLFTAVFVVTVTRVRVSVAPALVAAAVGAVLVTGAVLRIADAGDGLDLLVLYEIVLVVAAVALAADLFAARGAAMTDLVVDLASPGPATVREMLAAATGDPGLRLVYPLADGSGYVDDAGRPVTPPEKVTHVRDGGRTVALLSAATADRAMLAAVSGGLRIALANARLDADLRTRTAAVSASRRRLDDAAARQRRAIAGRLREDVDAQLERAAALIGDPQQAARLADVRRQLEHLAAGLGPEGLREGLSSAVGRLADGSGLQVAVSCPPGTFGHRVDRVAWFICSEALANVAKHAGVHHARVEVRHADGTLEVRVDDTGRGGAEVSGTGLVGLRERVASVAGELTIDSVPGRGTTVIATLPVDT